MSEYDLNFTWSSVSISQIPGPKFKVMVLLHMVVVIVVVVVVIF